MNIYEDFAKKTYNAHKIFVHMHNNKKTFKEPSDEKIVLISWASCKIYSIKFTENMLLSTGKLYFHIFAQILVHPEVANSNIISHIGAAMLIIYRTQYYMYTSTFQWHQLTEKFYHCCEKYI